jgi:hypothetical protein
MGIARPTVTVRTSVCPAVDEAARGNVVEHEDERAGSFSPQPALPLAEGQRSVCCIDRLNPPSQAVIQSDESKSPACRSRSADGDDNPKRAADESSTQAAQCRVDAFASCVVPDANKWATSTASNA